MKLHNCIIAVAVDKSGNPLHTVAKLGVNEKEIKLLQHLHGHDRVRNIVHVGDDEIEEREALLRLCRRYGDAEGVFGEDSVKLISKVFGVELHEFADWLMQTQEREEQERRERREVRDKRFSLEMALRAKLAAEGQSMSLQPEVAAPPPRMSSAEALLGMKQPPPAVEATLE